MGRENTSAGHGPEQGAQANATQRQPTTRAWGDSLRKAREAKGWTQADLAREMGWDPSVISKLETGLSRASLQHARAADRALGIPGVFEAWLSDVTNNTGGSYQQSISELEQRAISLDIWEPCFVPGLVQTEAYMREVYLGVQRSASDDVIQRMVDTRLIRQQIRTRVDPVPPELNLMFWETALRVPVGGPGVMHDQLMELADVARHDRRVRVQVLPLGTGSHVGMMGPFVVAGYHDEPPAAFTESILFGHITERRAEVTTLMRAFTTLAADALDPRASADLIEKVAGEWKP